jgi:hypothetical protein
VDDINGSTYQWNMQARTLSSVSIGDPYSATDRDFSVVLPSSLRQLGDLENRFLELHSTWCCKASLECR